MKRHRLSDPRADADQRHLVEMIPRLQQTELQKKKENENEFSHINTFSLCEK